MQTVVSGVVGRPQLIDGASFARNRPGSRLKRRMLIEQNVKRRRRTRQRFKRYKHINMSSATTERSPHFPNATSRAAGKSITSPIGLTCRLLLFLLSSSLPSLAESSNRWTSQLTEDTWPQPRANQTSPVGELPPSSSNGAVTDEVDTDEHRHYSPSIRLSAPDFDWQLMADDSEFVQHLFQSPARSREFKAQAEEQEGSRFQQRQQLSPTASENNGALTSLSNVTVMAQPIAAPLSTTRTANATGGPDWVGRRWRRTADAPGQVQLQEARRKQEQSAAGFKPAIQKRQVIQAMLNGQATLACNLQPPSQDDSVSLVLWYKDKSMVPIYSLDARFGPVEEARHKPGAWLEGRSSLRVFTQRDRSKRHANSAQEPPGFGGQVLATVVTPDGVGGGLHRNRRGRRTARRRQALDGLESFGLAHLTSPIWAKYDDGEQADQVSAHVNQVERIQVLGGDRLGPALALTAHLPAGQQRLTAQLQIESLSSEDNGVYSCRVDFRKARSRTQETLLQIIVPADKPTIKDLSADEPASSGGHATHRKQADSVQVTGAHNEGAKIVLQCETQGGYPEPTLTWWRDGKLVDDSYEVLVPGQSGAPQSRVASDGGRFALDRSRLASSSSRFDDEELVSASLDVGDEQLPAANRDPAIALSGSSSEQDLAEQTSLLLPPADSAASIASSSSSTRPLANPKQANQQSKLIRNRLELIGLSRADLFANYLCQAWNTKLSEPPSTSIMIDMNLRPIKVQIDNDRQPVLADKPLELVCRAFGSRPAATISWWRDGIRLRPAEALAPSLGASEHSGAQATVQQKEEGAADDSNVTISRLTIVPKLEDGGRLIGCRAENARFQAPSAETNPIEDTWKLDVHYLPRVKLALGDKLAAGPIREGHDVYFECLVQAHPNAQEIRWWFDGKELEANVSSGIIVSNQSLVLQRVSKHQRGRYTCSAINQVGEAHSNSLHLRVQFAPICRDSQMPDERPEEQNELFQAVSQLRHKSHYGAARLEAVRVQCHVDADPADSLSYKWAFVAQQQPAHHQVANRQQVGAGKAPEFTGQQLVYLDQSLISQNEQPLMSVATYTPRSELDYGTLLCWAQNALGQQGEPCAYQVVPAERPDPVRNCRLLNASDSQLVVGCEPGYDGGVDQRFQMEVYDSRKHELVANVTSAVQQQRATGPINGSQQPADTQNQSAPVYQDDEASQGIGGPASLVSEPVAAASRQQKQRHSKHSASLQANANSPASGGQQIGNLETVFITDANLKPATDYFLSIYSSNSKGSSKPVAFTATTANQTGGEQLGTLPARVRDGRPVDPSHLFSDVLALSWNPFLMLFGIVMTLLILITSITFVMMKYIDFSPMGPSSRSGSRDGIASSAASCKSFNGTSRAGNGGSQRSATARRNDDGHNKDEGRYGDDKVEVPPNSATAPTTTATAATQRDQSRARIITVANVPDGGALSEQVLGIPLNGMADNQRAERRRSLLNGSYLKLKLQQLTGQQRTPIRQLKQSNSENSINQLGTGARSSELPPHRRPFQLQQQAAFNSAGATLPKNMSGHSCDSNQNLPPPRDSGQLQVLAKLNANQRSLFQQQQQQQQQVFQMQDFESPYGAKFGGSLTGSASPSAGCSAASYSAASCATGGGGKQALEQQPALAALMFAGPQTNGLGSTSSSSSYLNHSGFPQVGETRVEQFIVAGKQYVHHTEGAPNRTNPYQRQQQQQQQQHRHLQLTSAVCDPAYGSLQRPSNNLYTAPMSDYLQLQQQQQQPQALYLAHHMNHQTGLFCEHRQQCNAATMGGDQIIDGLCLGGASCLAAVGAVQQAQVADNIQLGYRNGQLAIGENYHFSADNAPPPPQANGHPAMHTVQSSALTVNNNKVQQQLNGTSSKEATNGATTSDLGDEETTPSPPKCDNIDGHQPTTGCHLSSLAHLAASLQNGSGTMFNNAKNNDNSNHSDGMSSGQRSILTLSSAGSPLNGATSSDFEHQPSRQSHHPECHEASCNLQTVIATNNKQSHESDQASDLRERGGNVIGVTMVHPHHQLQGPDSTTYGLIKQAKKSLTKNNVIIGRELYLANDQQGEETISQSVFEPHLEQYTMYVDCLADYSHNLADGAGSQQVVGDYYLDRRDNQRHSATGTPTNRTTRVRVVGNSVHERAIANFDRNQSSTISSSSSTATMKDEHHLHTDV